MEFAGILNNAIHDQTLAPQRPFQALGLKVRCHQRHLDHLRLNINRLDNLLNWLIVHVQC